MRLTEQRLRTIIREELNNISEAGFDYMTDRISKGTKVKILPTRKDSRKYGTVSHEADSMEDHWWVDYDDEYGGKYWHVKDLEIIED